MRKQTVIHYEIELLYETTYRNACGTVNGKATKDEEAVTCIKCRRLLGHDC